MIRSGLFLLAVPLCAVAQQWSIRSGSVELRLAKNETTIVLDHLGPAGSAWNPKFARHADTGGLAGGRPLNEFRLVSAEPAGGSQLVTLKHASVPLVAELRYTAYGNTGVIGKRVSLINEGQRPLSVEALDLIAWQLPPAKYELTYLHGEWGHERQIATETLGFGAREFRSNSGRSSNGYSPWFVLHDTDTGVSYAAQLAWSGNWRMRFDAGARSDAGLRVAMGPLFDLNSAATLAPGERFDLPEIVFTTSTGDLDDITNQLHRYQREYVFPKNNPDRPLAVHFNSWYPYQGPLSAAELIRSADIVAKLGAETFVVDAGWYGSGNWDKQLGDWVVDRAKFPNGMEELSDHVRKLGMKFGMWVEIENAGIESNTAREHPGWFFQYDGRPLQQGTRYHLDFSKPEVRAWARSVMDRLVRDDHISWVKFDYNIDAGNEFDPGARPGRALASHIESYYRWLDELRAAYPDLVIENCSSGGLRFDLGILAHTHTTWLSDVVNPLASLQLGYGCTVEFAPEMCNHWMVGDTDKGEVRQPAPASWYDFLFRVPMNGQFGFSSRVVDWKPELLERARDNIDLYKRIRTVIAGADVYHLTPQPDHDDPKGWMAIQYTNAALGKTVLLAYRLKGGEPERTFRLRGIDREIKVSLPADFSAAVVEVP
jgi:alpha-galactosidase